MADITVIPIEDTNNFEEWKDKFNQLLVEITDVNSEVLITSPVTLQLSQDEDATTGLDFYFRDGLLRNEVDIFAIPAGFLTLADDSDNIVYLNNKPGFEGVESAVVGLEPAEEIIPLYLVTTVAGAITDVTDQRTYFIKAKGSAAGLPIEELFDNLVAPQSVFTLVGINTSYGISVYVDGARLSQGAAIDGADYEITGFQEVTLHAPAPAGVDVLIVMRDLEGDFNFDPIEEVHVAVDDLGPGLGQDEFILLVVPVSNKVAVYIQGVRQHSYTYDTPLQKVTLNQPIPLGTEVLFVVNDSAGGRTGVPASIVEGQVFTSDGLNNDWIDPKSHNYITNGHAQVARGIGADIDIKPVEGAVDGFRAFTTDAGAGEETIAVNINNDFNTGTWADDFYPDGSEWSQIDFTGPKIGDQTNKFPLSAAGSEFGVVSRWGSAIESGIGAWYRTIDGSASSNSTQTVDLLVAKREIEENTNVLSGETSAQFQAFPAFWTFTAPTGNGHTLEFDDGGITPLVEGVDYTQWWGLFTLLPAAFGATGQFPANGIVRVKRTDAFCTTEIYAGIVARMQGSINDHAVPLSGRGNYSAQVTGNSGAGTVTLSILKDYNEGSPLDTSTVVTPYAFDEETRFRLEFDVNGTTLTATLYSIDSGGLISGTVTSLVVVDSSYSYGHGAIISRTVDAEIDNLYELTRNDIGATYLDNYDNDINTFIIPELNQGVDTPSFKHSFRVDNYFSTIAANVYATVDVDKKALQALEGNEFYIRADVFHDLGENISAVAGFRSYDDETVITDEATYLANTTLHFSDPVTIDSGVLTEVILKGTIPSFPRTLRSPVFEILLPHTGAVDGDIEVTNVECHLGEIVYPVNVENSNDVLAALNANGDIATVHMFPYENVKRGYIICDGREVSRTGEIELFEEIGTTYGSGNGSTTFNVPDYRDWFIRGKSDVRAVGSTEGQSIQSHQHEMHNDSITTAGAPVGGSNGVAGGGKNFVTHGERITTYGADPLNTKFTGGSETRPKNIAMIFAIKAK